MKWAIFAACVKLCKIVTKDIWRVDEKLINLQAKLLLVPHVSALVNKRELFMMKTERKQIVRMELYLAVVKCYEEDHLSVVASATGEAVIYGKD